MSDDLRPAELAGDWYPSEPEACRAALEAHPAFEAPSGQWMGALVPHGGWRYSGRILAGTLRALAAARPNPDLLVVLGGHLDPGDPLRVFIEGRWATPLGPVPTPVALAESVAMAQSAEPETAEEYYDDSAVEVLMPALRYCWPDVSALVVGVPPDVDPGTLAREIHAEAEHRDYRAALVLGSVDLTHYGPDHCYRPRGHGEAAHSWVMEDNDAALLEHACRLEAHKVAWEGPRRRNTCSPGAAATALLLAKKLGATEGHVLAQSTSHLEGGEPRAPTSFVGYAGVLLGTAK